MSASKMILFAVSLALGTTGTWCTSSDTGVTKLSNLPLAPAPDEGETSANSGAVVYAAGERQCEAVHPHCTLCTTSLKACSTCVAGYIVHEGECKISVHFDDLTITAPTLIGPGYGSLNWVYMVAVPAAVAPSGLSYFNCLRDNNVAIVGHELLGSPMKSADILAASLTQTFSPHSMVVQSYHPASSSLIYPVNVEFACYDAFNQPLASFTVPIPSPCACCSRTVVFSDFTQRCINIYRLTILLDKFAGLILDELLIG